MKSRTSLLLISVRRSILLITMLPLHAPETVIVLGHTDWQLQADGGLHGRVRGCRTR